MKMRGYTRAFFIIIVGVVIVGVSACGAAATATEAPAATQPPAAATEPPAATTEPPTATEAPAAATEAPRECIEVPSNPGEWDCRTDGREVKLWYVPEDTIPYTVSINEDDINKELEMGGNFVSIAANILFLRKDSDEIVTKFENENRVALVLTLTDDEAGLVNTDGLRPVYTTQNPDLNKWLNFPFQDVYFFNNERATILFNEWGDQSTGSQTIGWATPRDMVECAATDPGTGTWDCSTGSRKIVFSNVPDGVKPYNVSINDADRLKPLQAGGKLFSIVADIWFLDESGVLVTNFDDSPLTLEIHYTPEDAAAAESLGGLRPIYTTKESDTWLNFENPDYEGTDNGAVIKDIKEWSDQPTGWGTPK